MHKFKLFLPFFLPFYLVFKSALSLSQSLLPTLNTCDPSWRNGQVRSSGMRNKSPMTDSGRFARSTDVVGQLEKAQNETESFLHRKNAKYLIKNLLQKGGSRANPSKGDKCIEMVRHVDNLAPKWNAHVQ